MQDKNSAYYRIQLYIIVHCSPWVKIKKLVLKTRCTCTLKRAQKENVSIGQGSSTYRGNPRFVGQAVSHEVIYFSSSCLFSVSVPIRGFGEVNEN